MQLEDKMSRASLSLWTKASLCFRDHWGYIFLLPAFSSFVGYCRRLVWVSLMCVCVWEVWRGGGETGRGMSLFQSLHFGIGRGSGLRGNITSSPSSLHPLTFSCIRSSSLCLSLPQSVPTLSQGHVSFFFLGGGLPEISKAVTNFSSVHV